MLRIDSRREVTLTDVPILLQNELDEVHETPAERAALHDIRCSSQPEGRATDREPFSLSRFGCGTHQGMRPPQRPALMIPHDDTALDPVCGWSTHGCSNASLDGQHGGLTAFTSCSCALQAGTSACLPRLEEQPRAGRRASQPPLQRRKLTCCASHVQRNSLLHSRSPL